LYLPFQRWVETNSCAASAIAKVLTRSNIQYEVFTEGDWNQKTLRRRSSPLPLWIIESPDILTEAQQQLVQKHQKHGGSVLFANQPNWAERLAPRIPHPSLEITGPSTVRGVLHDGPRGTVLHLYNLNLERIDSFTDSVRPAENLRVRCRVPGRTVHSVTAFSADPEATQGSIPFTTARSGHDSELIFQLPHLEISTLVVIE
jgi:hypothetical protein